MAIEVKISQLPGAAAITGAEEFPAVQSGGTVAPTLAQVRTYTDVTASGFAVTAQAAAIASAAITASGYAVDTYNASIATASGYAVDSFNSAIIMASGYAGDTYDAAILTASGYAVDAYNAAIETITLSGIVDIVYPVGSFYTQYPDADSNTEATEFPVAYWPATLFGGTWVEQWPTESVYFRTRGTLSDTGRTTGKQEDALQGHIHATQSQYPGTTGNTFNPPSGSGTNGNLHPTQGPITDGTNGTPRTAAETRTVNRRIKVWKRTA